jgi:protein-L-isoaspartate(D-aspartate) O-methyltransferase
MIDGVASDVLIDNSLHKGLRKKLISELSKKGITDEKVLQAFWQNPRHYFLDPEFDTWAYKDTAFKIDEEQTISHPYTVAFMTQLLDVNSGEKILEIGTGSGYQACILNTLGAKVYSIERHEALFYKTTALLKKVGHQSVRTIHGDGYLGLPRFAPFDKIIVTAGATSIPKTLLDQLKVGGILVIPFGSNESQIMTKITKVAEGQFTKDHCGEFSFVPFVRGLN